MTFKSLIGYATCTTVNTNLKKGDNKKERISYKDLRHKLKYTFLRCVKNNYAYPMLQEWRTFLIRVLDCFCNFFFYK